MSYLFFAAISFVLTYFLVPWVMEIAPVLGAVDYPSTRKVHTKPMPRLGGLAIYIGYIFSLMFFVPHDSRLLGLAAGSSVIVILGIFDDIYDIRPHVKLMGQIVAAGILVWSGFVVDFISHPAGGVLPLGLFSVPLTILWITGITNAVNLTDGLDGLAAGLAAISSLTVAVISMVQGLPLVAGLALILFGSTLGFLKYNFYPAEIFMGDSGSMLLGFNLAALSIMSVSKSVTMISVFIPVMILGVPIFDTLCAIIRRTSKKVPIFKADKEHIHHCLIKRGYSQKKAVLLMYFVGICMGITGILLSLLTSTQGMMMLTVTTTSMFAFAQKIGAIRIPVFSSEKTFGKKAESK